MTETRTAAKIGVLVPFTNTNLEPDMELLRPPNTTIHFQRMGGYDVDEIPGARPDGWYGRLGYQSRSAHDIWGAAGRGAVWLHLGHPDPWPSPLTPIWREQIESGSGARFR